MNNLKHISLAAVILCATASTSAFAQDMDYNPSWYIAPSLNLLYPDDGFGIDDRGEGAGLHFGKPIGENWDIQLGTTYARSNSNGVNYQQNLLGVDMLYMFSRKAVRPFLLVGIGDQEDRLSSPFGQTSGYAPYVNYGLGMQISLDDQWSMQVDFRRVHGYLNDNAFQITRDSNNYVTVGFNYAFDKPAQPAVAAPPPAPEAAPVVAEAPPAPPPPAPKFEKVVLSSTDLFAFNKSDLQMPQPKLDDIADALNKNTQIENVVVTGYTDRIGSDKYNMKLSEQRANAVKDYLVSKGVSATRLSAIGKGKANPVVVCTQTKRAALIDCLAPNRRVEVEQITIEQRVN